MKLQAIKTRQPDTAYHGKMDITHQKISDDRYTLMMSIANKITKLLHNKNFVEWYIHQDSHILTIKIHTLVGRSKPELYGTEYQLDELWHDYKKGGAH